MATTVNEAVEGVESGVRAVRELAELGPGDGAFREAMARLRGDMAALEAAVHHAESAARYEADGDG